MADETVALYAAPSSLVDHCRHLGMQRDPNNFGSSIPGGIWASPTRRKSTPSHSRTSSFDKTGENDHGVPIFRVDHRVNGEGTIFTPKDEIVAVARINVIPTAVPETGEVATCSQSLADFCKALGEKHDPTQFGTSVPGGCWGSSSFDENMKKLDGGGEKDSGVPIYRVEHKMNTDGFIFTPRTKSNMQAMKAGSLESDDLSWRGSPVMPVNLFENSPAAPPLNLFDNRSGVAARLANGPPEGCYTLSDVLPSVEEANSQADETSPPHSAQENIGDHRDPLEEAFEAQYKADNDDDEALFEFDEEQTQSHVEEKPSPSSRGAAEHTQNITRTQQAQARWRPDDPSCQVSPKKCCIS